MKAMDLQEAPPVRSRIWATAMLLAISFIIFYLGRLQIDKQLVTEFVAGLLVLGTAGIWVSFLAEKEARRTVLATAEGIRQASELSRVSAHIGLVRIFPNSDDENYHRFISDVLLKTDSQDVIRIVGVASRGLFHSSGGPHNPQIKALAARKVPIRVVLLHPLFEPAITRGIREDVNRRYFSDHLDSILLTDVILSCEGIVGLGVDSIQARLSPTATQCQVIFVGGLAIFQPLHFGSENQRASVDTPIFVFKEDSEFARRLSDHFEFLWRVSEKFSVSPPFVRNLRPQNIEMKNCVVDYMQESRPDLFTSTKNEDAELGAS